MQEPFPELTELRLWSFSIRPWVDLPHVCDTSGTFHPRQIGEESDNVPPPCCPASKHFPFTQSRPDWESRCPPPSKHSVTHALDYFRFKGVVEYLEDLVTCIDNPPTEELSSMKSILIVHDSPTSSILYQYSRHAMKHVWNLMMPPSTSDFNTRHWHLGLTTTNSLHIL
jgi:hypothetical protein